jgi:hypothetical protein
VRELAAHVLQSGQGFVDNVRRGLAGSAEPPTQHPPQLDSTEPSSVSRALTVTTSDFISLYDGLDDAQLDAICFHRRGNRSVRWYAAHRLAEVAFHAWDLSVSLGKEPVFDDEVAALLLPTLLESNVPRTYAAGLSVERGRGERFLLAVDDDPSARWLVTIDPDALNTRRGDAGADLTLEGPASALALLVYGRRELPRLVASKTVRASGDARLVDRFALIFPRP